MSEGVCVKGVKCVSCCVTDCIVMCREVVSVCRRVSCLPFV